MPPVRRTLRGASKGRSRHEEVDDEDEDDRKTRRRSRDVEDDDEDEDETPRSRKVASSRRASRHADDDDEDEDERPAKRKSRRDVEDDDDDEDDTPSAKKRRRDDDEDEDDEPKAKRTSGSGWGKVASKSKANKEASDNNINEFWLADGETAIVQFYDDEPFCTEGHSVQVKGKWKFVPCQLAKKRHCLMCEDGVAERWAAIFKVADYRGTWDNTKKRFKHDKEVQKVWILGTKLAEQLQKYVEKKGKPLTSLVLEITRSGEGMKASYNIAPAWDEEDDKAMKPKKLKDEMKPLDVLFAPPTDDFVIEHYI